MTVAGAAGATLLQWQAGGIGTRRTSVEAVGQALSALLCRDRWRLGRMSGLRSGLRAPLLTFFGAQGMMCSFKIESFSVTLKRSPC